MPNVQEEPARREQWLALGAVAVLMALVLRNAWVTEDTYITLRAIDNWVNGYGLRWNVDERVQAYTHPLWMLLLTLPYLVGQNAYASALLLSLAVTLIAAVALVRTARSGGHALAAVALVMCSRSFIDYSTSGLENPLSHLLIATLVWLYVVREAHLFPIAMCAGLLALNRTDTLLVALPPLLHTSLLTWRERGAKETLRELLLGFSPYFAWELFSLFYYGFLVPNTAFAKLNTGLPRRELAQQGLAYFTNGVAWDPALPVVLIAGLAAAFIERTRRSLLLALSVLLYLAYVVQIGGDFMQGRFFTVPLFLAACLVATSRLPLHDLGRVAAMLAPLGLLFLHPSGHDYDHAYTGVEDERKFYKESLGLARYARTNGPPRHLFRDVGEQFAASAQTEPVKSVQNVGIIGYYAGPRMHVVDENALTDPLLGRLPIRYNPNWRIGHYTRHIPEGYLQTIQSGKCQMSDADLCTYYMNLREIIAGDLWSFSRFKKIAIMNFGGYDSLIDEDRYRHPERASELLQNVTAAIEEGAPWNHPAARALPPDGIELSLGQVSHAKSLAISFDSNDAYHIDFRLGKSSVGTITSASPNMARMQTRTLAAPELAVEKGFDRLRIRPVSGDGMYSFGYVRISR